MTVRDLLHIGKSPVTVSKGANPIRGFQDEMNKLFADFFGDMSLPSLWKNTEMSPALDVSENDKEYKITAELPGMDIKDVQISVADGYVTIKGEKKEEKKEEKEGYVRQERSYGSFQRVVALPETANLEKAEASIAKGVLSIAIPKKAGAQSKERKLEIKQAA
ncbi:MAG: Hsp20/alpha crystallin family protein [Alphaproteobacteria bacterium]|nr:Hsp20/alpha crystallin family protein [Alphaproteobacteria bacterium]